MSSKLCRSGLNLTLLLAGLTVFSLQLPVAATYGFDAIGDAIRDSLVPGRASKGKILLRP